MDDLSSAPLLPNEIIDLIIEFSTDISTLHALCLTSHNCVHTARKYLYEHITLSSASYSSLHTHFELGGERLSQWCTTLSDLNPNLALYLTACTILDLDDEDDWSVVVIILRSAENLKHFAILNPPSEHIHDLLHGHSFHLTSFTFLSHLEDDVDKLIIQFLGDQLRTLSDLLILGPENEALTSFRTQLSITNPTYSEQSKLKILGGEQTTLEELLPLHPRVREIVWMPTNEQESDNLVLTSTAFRDALSHITSLTLATFPEMLSFRPSLTSLCDCLTALEDLHISGRHYVS
ncbi:hypothetical protein AN958_05238 [Leucoagaricus sp. SymC.cos]|nr:hypothetical protein AN958_05238 [Leucoagaricus sp. SymC.cos]